MSAADPAASARRWMSFAREDLAAARVLLGETAARPRHACWLAQQAAEKALKSALVLAQVEFPYQHDLDGLRNLLPADWAVRQLHPDLASLTQWAVESRYPGQWPEPSRDQAAEAVGLAAAVLDTVSSDLEGHGLHGP